jgi:hypothetical protein
MTHRLAPRAKDIRIKYNYNFDRVSFKNLGTVELVVSITLTLRLNLKKAEEYQLKDCMKV